MDGEPLHRTKGGERCEQCGSRRYYVQEGFRYCENGHQLEGVQYALEAGDDGAGGANPGARQTTRRRKTAEDGSDDGSDNADAEDDGGGEGGAPGKEAKRKRRKERRRTLTGPAARELYLECLQLVLRKQVAHLVRSRGLPESIEGVARALWSLRVRDCPGLRPEAADGAETEDDERGERRVRKEKGAVADAEDEPILYSSQPESGPESDSAGPSSSRASRGRSGSAAAAEARRRRRERSLSWQAPGGDESSGGEGAAAGGDGGGNHGDWRVPRLVDTLAIVYIACVLVSVPVRIGDLARWATKRELCFLPQTLKLPLEMRSLLPKNYQRMLMPWVFRGGELHKAVTELVASYALIYKLKLPPLNTPLILYQYVRDLALPIEVYPVARIISMLMSWDFGFPIDKPASNLVDDPDVRLAALVVFTTKLLFPFDGIPRIPHRDTEPTALMMDWKSWQIDFTRDTRPEPTMSEMTLAELDELVARTTLSVESRSTKNDEILRFFNPTGVGSRASTPGPAVEAATPLGFIQGGTDDLDQRVIRMLAAMNRAVPDDRYSTYRPGSHYQVYETEQELPEVARMFYAKCAEVAGLQMPRLIRAVVLVENELRPRRKAQN